MSTDLDAVYEELVRLKGEGIDHVYLDDATLAQLRSIPKATPKPTKVTSELKSLMERKPEAPVALQSQAPKKTAAPVGKPLPEAPPSIELPEGDPETRMRWLRDKVDSCPTCKEHLSEFGKIVFGAGKADADIFFCGEAPGADEEAQGEPFVGPAGQLLTKIIQAMGLQREEVYIGNILKWRPEHDKPFGNRPPTIEEMNFCLPYLNAQIEIVQPKVIVALGNTAVTGLLGHAPDRRLSSVRGQWHTFNGTPLMITFHPSYLLRNGTLGTKRKAWEDMLKVMDKVGLSISEKQRGFFLPKS